MLPCLLGGEPSPTSLQRHTNHLQLCLLGGKPTLMLLCLLGGEPSPTSLQRHTNHLQLCLLGGKTTLMLLCLLGGKPSPTSLHLPLENPKKTAPFCYGRFVGSNLEAMLSEKQRHFVTVVSFQGMCPKNSAILLRLICWKQPHKQCCPRNSAILLRSFLSRACTQKTAPFCYGRFVGNNLTSNAVMFITS